MQTDIYTLSRLTLATTSYRTDCVISHLFWCLDGTEGLVVGLFFLGRPITTQTGRDRNHKIQTKTSKEKFEPIDPDGKIIAILGIEENATAPCFFFLCVFSPEICLPIQFSSARFKVTQ